MSRKEKAFLAGPVPRMRGKLGSLKALSMQVSEPDFKRAEEEELELEADRDAEAKTWPSGFFTFSGTKTLSFR